MVGLGKLGYVPVLIQTLGFGYFGNSRDSCKVASTMSELAKLDALVEVAKSPEKSGDNLAKLNALIQVAKSPPKSVDPVPAKNSRETDACPRCKITQLDFAAKHYNYQESKGRDKDAPSYTYAWKAHLRKAALKNCTLPWDVIEVIDEEEDIEVDDHGRDISKLKKKPRKKLTEEEQQARAVCPGCATLRADFIREYMEHYTAKGWDTKALNAKSSWNNHWNKAKKGVVCAVATWGRKPAAAAPARPKSLVVKIRPKAASPAPEAAASPAPAPKAAEAPAPPVVSPAVPVPVPVQVPIPPSLPDLTTAFFKRSIDQCKLLRNDLAMGESKVQAMDLEIKQCDYVIDKWQKKRKELASDREAFVAKRQRAGQVVADLEASLAAVNSNIRKLNEIDRVEANESMS
jgi:hypothetical protein